MFGLFGTGMRKNIQFFVFLTVLVAPCFVYADTTTTNNPSQINVTRSYVKIPIATGAPSTNTPTGFVEIWFQ